MLQSARKFFWDRRRTFFTVAGLLGGTWFLVRYVISQLAEMRDKVVRDRDAREKYVVKNFPISTAPVPGVSHSVP